MKKIFMINKVNKSHSLNINSYKYKLPEIEIKLVHSFSFKNIKKKKNKIEINPLFKSTEIKNKLNINKNKRISLNSKESIHNSINMKFKSLNEREIILKNSDLFMRNSKIRMKNEDIRNGIKQKIEGYKKLFKLIDRNNTGILSLKNLNLSLVTNDELEILTPFLIELQKKRKNMNFKEFCILIDRNLTSKYFFK